MKEVWMCRWETIPGDGEHTEKFLTLAAAKKAMRQKISQSIDLREYLADFEPDAAKYLNHYLTDPDFPRSEEDVPKDYIAPEHGDLALYGSWIRWDYPYDAHPYLNTNVVLTETDNDYFFFDFWYNHPEKANSKGVAELTIRIFPRMEYGSSGYPLMVWKVLHKTPQTQEQIIRNILETWSITVDRKAVGRHLQLLQDFGFPVQKCKHGYYVGEACAPKAGGKFGTSAYPLMVLQALDATPRTQEGIIQVVFQRYGIKIDRKAVKRHLDLLKELKFGVQKNRGGYYISK